MNSPKEAFVYRIVRKQETKEVITFHIEYAVFAGFATKDWRSLYNEAYPYLVDAIKKVRAEVYHPPKPKVVWEMDECGRVRMVQ